MARDCTSVHTFAGTYAVFTCRKYVHTNSFNLEHIKLLSFKTLQNTNLVANVNSLITTVIHYEVDTKSVWHRNEKCDVQTRGFVVLHFSISIILRKFL